MIFLLSVLIVLVDQWTKKWAVKYLMGERPIKIIENFFHLTYVENYGAAFGILQNQKIFFIVITVLTVGGITIYSYYNYSEMSLWMKLCLALGLGGAIGNFIDRFRMGYVVDFLSFKIFGYNFPVFNVADIAIVVGTFILVVIVLSDEFNEIKEI